MPGDSDITFYKRPPKTREPKHVAYCEAAKTTVELTICADRQLWQLQRYVVAAYRAVLVDEPKLTQELAASRTQFTAKLNACKADAACLRGVLRDTINTLVEQYHPDWCSAPTFSAPVYSFKKTDGMGCIRGDID